MDKLKAKNINTETYHIERIRTLDKVILRERKSILDFRINLGDYASFINQIISLAKVRSSSVVCVANVHMFIEAHRDPAFLEILNKADIVTPDGRPLVWSLQILFGIRQDRVCGMDLLPDLLKRLMQENLSVYFYGGSPDILKRTRVYLKTHYSSLKIAGTYSPPYRRLTATENRQVVETINKSRASVVIVVLGCPKQEKWMSSMKGKINATMIGIGGALPVMIGEKKRAPRWMQEYGFEWLYRFYQEPTRLFKRYTSTNFYFLYLMIKEVAAVKLFGKSGN